LGRLPMATPHDLVTISERSMGILPMSITGVPPVQTPKNMAKMAMLLTGKMPVLLETPVFIHVLGRVRRNQ